MDNMIHFQICEDHDCELCEELVTNGIVWSCDHCGGLVSAVLSPWGDVGEVICSPCFDKSKEKV